MVINKDVSLASNTRATPPSPPTGLGAGGGARMGGSVDQDFLPTGGFELARSRGGGVL